MRKFIILLSLLLLTTSVFNQRLFNNEEYYYDGVLIYTYMDTLYIEPQDGVIVFKEAIDGWTQKISGSERLEIYKFGYHECDNTYGREITIRFREEDIIDISYD